MRTFVIYKDLVVREYKEFNKDLIIDSIGVITSNESDSSYTPTKYQGGFHDFSVKLWNWSIVNDKIIINQYFSIIKIKECPDSTKKHSYWRELIIVLEDNFKTQKSYSFYIRPESIFTYENLQKFLLEINEELKYNNSFKMLEINKENEQLKYIISSLEEDNSKLIKEKEDLQQCIGELEDKLNKDQDEDNNN